MKFSERTATPHNFAESLNELLREAHESAIEHRYSDTRSYEYGYIVAGVLGLISDAAPDIELYNPIEEFLP
ncbi:hypothetical protein [Nocardia jiangxiensis]|uniref:hypothetical protein n=1 Tax=Nocardia jiangxiensis TaxID=282685 RepID=UPI0003038F64|nr:hypothetical protein [Nocardia jiangxiensis]